MKKLMLIKSLAGEKAVCELKRGAEKAAYALCVGNLTEENKADIFSVVLRGLAHDEKAYIDKTTVGQSFDNRLAFAIEHSFCFHAWSYMLDQWSDRAQCGLHDDSLVDFLYADLYPADGWNNYIASIMAEVYPHA